MRPILVIDNDWGEWSVADLLLDHRKCSFNAERHGGPHLHHPLDAPAGIRVALESAAAARAVLEHYGRGRSWSDAAAFEELVAQWRSESKNG